MEEGLKIEIGAKLKLKDRGEVEVVSKDSYNVVVRNGAGNRVHIPAVDLEKLVAGK